MKTLNRLGITYACLATGSRSTPIALVLAKQHNVTTYILNDERSAGYFALGIAKITKQPTLIVCTSGTALANLYPSVLEAYYDNHPLILMTADRPQRLYNSGSNQTMDQIEFFGKHVNLFIQVDEPKSDYSQIDLDKLRNIAFQSYQTSINYPQGPVHLNIPFDKPLQPTDLKSFLQLIDQLDEKYVIKGTEPKIQNQIDENKIQAIAKKIGETQKGFIIVGPNHDEESTKLIYQIAQKLNFPILADPLSGLRYKCDFQSDLICVKFESYIENISSRLDRSDFVLIQFGLNPISKFLLDFLDQSTDIVKIRVSNTGRIEESTQNLEIFITGPSIIILKKLISLVKPISQLPNPAKSLLLQCEKMAETIQVEILSTVVELNEPRISRTLFDEVASETPIFVANSLPIRMVDQFVHSTGKNIFLFGNRGMSGIDGNISTALGIAAAIQKPIFVLTGDLTFYHDITGLLAAQKYDLTIIIILLNNNGGGIFKRLPIAKYGDIFETFFTSSHDLNFSAVADIYKIQYVNPINEIEFSKAIKSTILNPVSTIIELRVDSTITQELRDQIINKIKILSME